MYDNKIPETKLILQDMADGVMTIAKNGVITYLNARGSELLGIDLSSVGQTVALCFIHQKENEDFVQLIIDATLNKDMRHKQTVDYSDGVKKMRLEVSVTYLSQNRDVIIVFTDVTEREKLVRQKRDSIIVICALFSVICVTVLAYKGIYSFWLLDMKPQTFTLIAEGIALTAVVIALPFTSLTLDDMGVRVASVKKAVLPGIIISVIGIVIMVVFKIIMISVGSTYFPKNTAFFDLTRWTFSNTIYPLTAVFQEFLSRSVMHTALKHVFDGKYSAVLAVVISSLIFSSLHIAYNLPFMLGAMLLLGSLGFFFEKTKNIWSLSIVHYTLGQVAYFLWII